MNLLVMDKVLAILFALATGCLIYVFISNDAFFNWAFERHQNQLSWYIRPLFLIPFCFFSFKKSWSGISITVFLLFTSMFWFNKPDIVDEQVVNFLQFEKTWLQSPWDIKKWIFTLVIPLSFYLLALVFWRRQFLFGGVLLFAMALGKIMWSVYYSGEDGMTVIFPAILGLTLCFAVLYYILKIKI